MRTKYLEGTEAIMNYEPLYPRIQRHTFCRPVNWRWQRTSTLVRDGRNYTRRLDDEATGRAMRYLRNLRRCHTTRRLGTVASRYPDLDAARLLEEESEGRTRAEVQARLLAGQSSEQIAERTGLPATVIDTYECHFLQVRGYLDARDWIAIRAIRRWECDSTARPTPVAVLHSFAYYGGPFVLEAMLPYLLGGRDWTRPVADLTTAEGRLDQSIRLSIAVEMLPRNAETAAKLWKIPTLLHDRSLETPDDPIASLLAKLALVDWEKRCPAEPKAGTTADQGKPASPVLGCG